MTKKDKDTAAKAPKELKSVEELILDYKDGKYSAIPLCALWAKVLRRKEENRHLTSSEILDLALRDVLGGVIDWKDIKKANLGAAAETPEALNGSAEKSKSK